MSKQPESYIFMRNGRVQWWDANGRKGMLFAPTRELANQFAAWTEKHEGYKVAVAEVGTIDGETLQIQLDASISEGADCAFLLRSIDDGEVTCDVMTRED
jgi:hypothetical protein